jgi:hypothetical protein
VDPQDPVAVVDLGLFRDLHVARLRRVRRQDLDDGVGPVGCDDLDAAGGDVEDGGDRGGGVELRHCSQLLCFVVSDSGNATLRSRIRQRSRCTRWLFMQFNALQSLQWSYF